MNVLVIIPSLHHKYSFSAPLAWLFSNCSAKIRGIYSETLRSKDLSDIDLCIVELNWFIELSEFGYLVAFIKKHKKECKILFGGLYSQIKYKEIFKRFDVDYFIKGFAELPIKQLLDGHEPSTIPNLAGKTFENETTYYPTHKDLENIEYNLDWFPDYFRNWALFPGPDTDFETDFSSMPLFPSYRYPKKITDPSKAFRVPPRGGRYHLPMIVTARGRCRTIHDGCSYCMGSKLDKLREIYGCDGIVLDNDMVKKNLRQIAERFKQATLYINSPFEYDFTGEHYDLDITIEVDCPVTPEQLGKIIHAFSKATVHLVLYKEGHLDGACKSKKLQDVNGFLRLADEKHRIYFFAFRDDANAAGLPAKHRLYSEFVFPKWTDWEFYTDFDKAMGFSKKWFMVTRQYNLFPLPKAVIMRFVTKVIFVMIYLANRLGIKKDRDEILFGKPIS